MTERLNVDEPAALLAHLVASLPGWRRNTLKHRLRTGCIEVNGKPVYRHDHALVTGDAIAIHARPDPSLPPRKSTGKPPLYIDQDLVAIDKPAGLLSVSTDRQKTRTALSILRETLKRAGQPDRLWPVHRLDRGTSGVLLFARASRTCDLVQSRWTEAEKTYLAVVEGHPDPDSGTVEAPLWEDRNLRVHVGEHPEAKAARTEFKTLERGAERSLLEVRLGTGRRHQIRAHLAWLGHPIVGDDRYGTADSRLLLHARLLVIPSLQGPGSLQFEAPPPAAMRV